MNFTVTYKVILTGIIVTVTVSREVMEFLKNSPTNEIISITEAK